MLRSRRANAHLLVRFNTWTSQRLLNWNPILKLTIVLIWKTPACLKFGKKSNSAVENLLQRKLRVWAANDANFPVFLFELFLAQWSLVKCNALWQKVWLNAMHCGKKWWIREFVAPYIFPLNPDYVAARSLRSLRSNNTELKKAFRHFLTSNRKKIFSCNSGCKRKLWAIFLPRVHLWKKQTAGSRLKNVIFKLEDSGLLETLEYLSSWMKIVISVYISFIDC